MNIEEIFAHLNESSESSHSGKGNGKKHISRLPEATIMMLREIADRYLTPNTYTVGQIVKPAPWAPIRNKETPHLIIETGNNEPVFEGDMSSNTWGRRNNLRVLSFVNDDIVASHWVDSAEFDLWMGD